MCTRPLALLGFCPLWGSSCCLNADTASARRLETQARATARPLRACSCRVELLIICRKLDEEVACKAAKDIQTLGRDR